MKIFTLAFLLLSSNYIKAQNCKNISLGTKTVYPASPVLPGTSSPAGYEAVFINYIGRHGARHMTKDLGGSDTYRLLKQADSLHALSADGQKLWQMVQQLAAIERKEIKNISYLGRQEQQGIGKRMAESHPTVFHTEHTSLNITVTYKKKNTNAYLVKFFLNEREARIEGLAPGRFPYYTWSAVRKFYLDKLERLGASPDMDGLAYLREAK